MTINVNLSSNKWTSLLKAAAGAGAAAALAYVTGHTTEYGAYAGVIVLALEAAEGVLSFGTGEPASSDKPVVPQVPVN